MTLFATKTSFRGFCSALGIFCSGEGKGSSLAETLQEIASVLQEALDELLSC